MKNNYEDSLENQAELERMLEDRKLNPKQIQQDDRVNWEKKNLDDTVISIGNNNGVLKATLLHDEEKAPLLELEKLPPIPDYGP